MRRLIRLTDALASPAALTVTTRLLQGPATQTALLETLASGGVKWQQPQLSGLMMRLEDLGLVERASRKSPYELAHPDETAALVHHLAALGVAMARADGAAAAELEDLARRARVRLTETQDAEEST